MSRKMRAQAAMIGFAVGDSLGSTTEFCSPEEIKSTIGVHRDITGGGWLELPADNCVTDDTEMTLCVARSLVECGGFNSVDMANKLVDWYNSDPVDIGHTCRAGIHRFIRTGEVVRPLGDEQAGNGALMRVLPFALADQPNVNAIVHSSLTHNNELSHKIIQVYLDMVKMALKRPTKDRVHNVFAHAALGFAIPTDETYDGKAGGYVVETFKTVLYCFFSTDSFEDALIKCANLGGDADTTCAILGGLAGAFYEFEAEAIPERWMLPLNINLREELQQLAKGLHLMVSLTGV